MVELAIDAAVFPGTSHGNFDRFSADAVTVNKVTFFKNFDKIGPIEDTCATKG